MIEITDEQFEAERIAGMTPAAVVQAVAGHQLNFFERNGDADGISRMKRAQSISAAYPSVSQIKELRELFGDSPGRTKCKSAFEELEKLATARDVAREDHEERQRLGNRRAVNELCPLLGLPLGTPGSDVRDLLEEQGLKELAARVEKTPWPVLELYRAAVETARSMSSSFASVLGCSGDFQSISESLVEHQATLDEDVSNRLVAAQKHQAIATLAALHWGRMKWNDAAFSQCAEHLGGTRTSRRSA